MIHSFSHTLSLNASEFAGRHILFRPGTVLIASMHVWSASCSGSASCSADHSVLVPVLHQFPALRPIKNSAGTVRLPRRPPQLS